MITCDVAVVDLKRALPHLENSSLFNHSLTINQPVITQSYYLYSENRSKWPRD